VGCDRGPAELEDAHGPPLQVVATYPPAGAGLDCGRDSPPDCGVPANAQIELRFNRYLDPATAVRQSLQVYTSSPDLWVGGLRPQYDVVERVVVFGLHSGGTWLSGVRYNLELVVPEAEQDFGFRAFDGARLSEEGSAPLELSFRVQTGAVPTSAAAGASTGCVDVDRALGVFARGGCQNAICHQPVADSSCPAGYARAGSAQPCVGVPRMGLDLSSAEGLAATAINQVAHQTETGPSSGEPLENPDRFGVEMPVIDPGRPGNSYLVYKLLVNQALWRREECRSAHWVALAGQCPAPSRAELRRLEDWFVLGQPMPPTGVPALGRSDLELLQSWIAQGALTEQCP
jgi:hypothetical protein